MPVSSKKQDQRETAGSLAGRPAAGRDPFGDPAGTRPALLGGPWAAPGPFAGPLGPEAAPGPLLAGQGPARAPGPDPAGQDPGQDPARDPAQHIADLKAFSKSIYDRAIESARLSAMDPKDISITGLRRGDIVEKLGGLLSCASWLEVRGYKDGSEKVHHANFCKQPAICPVCSNRLQGKRRSVLESEIKTAALNHNYAYMVTFTIPSGPDLYDQITKLKRSIRDMRRKGQKRTFGYSAGELGKAKAGIFTIEIKIGCFSGEYHVHAHALVFTDRPLDFETYDQEKKAALKKKYGAWIPKEELEKIPYKVIEYEGKKIAMSKLRSEWYAVSGGINIKCDMIYHIPPWAQGEMKKRFAKMGYAASVFEQCREITKYITKFTDYENLTFGTPQGDMVIDIMKECFGRVRHYSTIGEFRSRFSGPDDYFEGGNDHIYSINKRYDVDLGMYVESVSNEKDEDSFALYQARSDSARALAAWRKERRRIGDAARIAGPGEREGLFQALDLAKRSFRGAVVRSYQGARAAIERLKKRQEQLRILTHEGDPIEIFS